MGEIWSTDEQGGKVRTLDKKKGISYNAAVKTSLYVCLAVKVYLNGHIDISHLSPEN